MYKQIVTNIVTCSLIKYYMENISQILSRLEDDLSWFNKVVWVEVSMSYMIHKLFHNEKRKKEQTEIK